MQSESSRIFRGVTALAVVYIMLRPVGYNEVLLPVLAALGLVSFGAVMIGRRWASLHVIGVLLLLVVAGGLAGAVGSANPGIFNLLLVWVAAPVLFACWALGADEKALRTTLAAMAWATIGLSLLILLYVGSQLGLPVTVPLWLVEETGGGFDIAQGATAIRLLGLSTLVAAAPMWIVAALVPSHPLLPPRWVRFTAGASAAAAALLGGRDAIVLVMVLVPLLVVAWRAVWARRGSARAHPLLVYAAFLTVLAAPFVIGVLMSSAALRRTWDNVTDFFQGGGRESIRVEQSDRLLTAWVEAPWFGHGLGATIPGYARSAERPWEFELQYHLALFQFGIVGSLLLVTVLVLAAVAVVRGARARPDMLPVFTVAVAGAVAMLIANATNPYLAAPGHMWATWLPLMVANVALASRRPTNLRVPKADRLALA